MNPDGSATTTSASSRSRTEEALVAMVKPAAAPPPAVVVKRVPAAFCTIVPSLVLVRVQKDVAVPVNPKVSVLAKAGWISIKGKIKDSLRLLSMTHLVIVNIGMCPPVTHFAPGPRRSQTQ